MFFVPLQRGYLPSRDTLLNSLLGEANRNNVGAHNGVGVDRLVH